MTERERLLRHAEARLCHDTGIQLGHKQPRYYTGAHPFAGGLGDPARGAFTVRPKSRRKGRRRRA